MRRSKKRTWGALNGRWAPHDLRDEVVDFVAYLAEKTDLSTKRLVSWLGISKAKFYSWRERYGKANEHNGQIPRDFWIEDWERRAILDFQEDHPLDGYRRMTFMMLDQDIVAVSPSTTYRVLKGANRLQKWSRKKSKKGNGFRQPLTCHEHWHIDLTYINIAGTFYYLCAILDGYSRFVVHWEIRESMKEWEVELILERAKEKFPDAKPRIITDNGPQFIARDFKEFVRISGMTHVRTSPYYPQSNGKIEAWNGTLKSTTIRPNCPSSLEEAVVLVGEFVQDYNDVRLHSGIGYIAPADKLAGREEKIWAARDQKLEAARDERRRKRLARCAS